MSKNGATYQLSNGQVRVDLALRTLKSVSEILETSGKNKPLSLQSAEDRTWDMDASVSDGFLDTWATEAD